MTPQLMSFLAAVLCGAFAMVLWAIIDAVRDTVRVNVFWNGIMDVIWWAAAVSFFCTAMWQSSSMDLRFFEFIGAGLGAILCRYTLGLPIRWLFSRIFQIFLKIIKFIFKILLTPWGFLYKILVVPIMRVRRVKSKKVSKSE